MKYFISILFIISHFLIFSQTKGQIILTNDNLGHSFSQNTLIIEDENKTISVENIISKQAESFYQLNNDNPAMKFSTSRFWMKFSIINQSNCSDLILETARPITDQVFFYEIKNNAIHKKHINGDDFNYYGKTIQHRKNLFPVQLNKGEEKHFIIEVISGGEGIKLPIKIHDKSIFYQQDYKVQFTNGFYFGLMSLVIVIYLFFFLILKDSTFLYFILYVFFQGLLQFSLDGYSHHHFFSDNAYMVNRFPPFCGAIAIIFMLIYVNKFLDLKTVANRFRIAFVISGLLVGIALVFVFLPGKLHGVSYPMINISSLISILLSVITIFYLRTKKNKVDNYFTLAFLILITGAIIFILGNFNIIHNSTLSLNALKISSILQVIILSISMSYKYRELQKDKEEAQAIALINLEEKNAIMDESNVRLERQVLERTSEIEKQRSELANFNKEIVSSIKYAKRIQEAILPSEEMISRLLPDSFIYYLPKDVVSGDFYFIESTPSRAGQVTTVFSAVDCTGHGVPGAFMSIVGYNFLSQAMVEETVNSPADALEYLNKGVSKTLKQNSKGESVRDGMDMAFCALNESRTELSFAGAKNPIYMILPKPTRQGMEDLIKSENDTHILIEIKGDKQPIGNHSDSELKPFTNHTIAVEKGDLIYIFTDGFADQFGGEKGKKFNYKRFRGLLLDIIEDPLPVQKQKLQKAFNDWKGELEQVDDVLIMGVKI